MPLASSAVNNVPYSTYSYSYEGEPVPSPHAYVPGRIVSGSDLGLSALSSPDDLCLDSDGNIYIADTGNGRVIAVSADFSAVRTVSGFTFEGTEYSLKAPTGLYMTEGGELYVADSTGVNIYVFDRELNCTRVIGRPQSSLLPADFSYIPTKLAVDKAGRMFIVSAGNTYGVVALNERGEFSTFIGAQKVGVSVLDRLWRKFMTKEQRRRTQSYVPTNYNNISIDEKGFLYVTATYSNLDAVIRTIQTGSTDDRYAMIKKLNPSGEDVLVRGDAFPPGGDVEIAVSSDGNTTNTDIYYGPSSIVDVAVGSDGVYALADQKRGKIFCYNERGSLLYAFGGTGQQEGLFRQLAAIEYDGANRIVALDKTAGEVTVFEPTGYGALVQEAIHLTNARQYEESVPVYRQILLENANFDIANIGIGTAMLRKGEYKEAMRYFKLANDVEDYSRAYSEYRRGILGDHILLIPVAVVLLCFLISRFFRFAGRYNGKTPTEAGARRTMGQELMYAFYVIFHPFKGFWDLKRARRGSVRAATVILALTLISLLFRGVSMGYVYTGRTSVHYNLPVNLLVMLGAVAIWCVANRCLTSFMYGEGSLKDVYVASCYALLPIVFFTLPAVVLSNFITRNEVMFVDFFFAIGYLWAAFLLFCAILSTHDYQFGSNVIAVSLTLVGMIVIVFLMLLFVNLIGQMISTVTNVYNEITFRL